LALASLIGGDRSIGIVHLRTKIMEFFLYILIRNKVSLQTFDNEMHILRVSNSTVVLGRYQYEAEGLEKGECGLRINSENGNAEDLGKWTCVARLQGKAQEGQDFITLMSNGMSANQPVGHSSH
jgi:hypothetical protein